MLIKEESWKYRVYHPSNDDFPKENWRELRRTVIHLDNYVCQACGTPKYLTVHHIIPRSQGGPDEVHNLITLCTKCHDLIEIAISEGEWLYSRGVITGYFDDVIDVDEPVAKDKNKWQLWVYGSYKRPKY